MSETLKREIVRAIRAEGTKMFEGDKYALVNVEAAAEKVMDVLGLTGRVPG